MTRTEAEKLYATNLPTEAVMLFEAGTVSLELHGGAVRYIRYAGHEAIRGVDYLVRDDSWRTPPADLQIVEREQSGESFRIVLDGEVKQDEIHYRYRLQITGDGDGHIEISADAEAHSSFLTNRTGFVVLHPIVGVAGRPVTVTHKDGSTSETTFPDLISPGQPIFDIRALRHEVAPGLFVNCRMEAQLPHDPETIYEMEDQRNWTDASYKTYVGSLLDPWPYRIEAGQKIAQRVVLTFESDVATHHAAAGSSLDVTIGEKDEGKVPDIGLGLMPQYRSSLKMKDHVARALRPQFLTFYAECDDTGFVDAIADYQALAEAYGTQTQLELVLPEGESPEMLLRTAAEVCEKARFEPTRVIVCPRAYLKSTQPVGPWPEVYDLAHIHNKAREAFPRAEILGGMLSYFTELNRKRPHIATVDAVSCTTTPIVHAADDQSVMETLETLPAVVSSMQAIAAGKPLHLGPSAIGMRHNPYGAATADNPNNERIAMVENDPRQCGLFAGAWTVGYAAAVADSQAVRTLCLNHLAGPAGVSGDDGEIYPVFHVMKALCAAGGAARIPLSIAGTAVAGLAWRDGGSISLLLTNLGPEPTTLTLNRAVRARILDTTSFDTASHDLDWRTRNGSEAAQEFTLGAYATLFANA
ncbi:MAG: hypothetical protein AAFY56_14970 [Pseudomonadota bacterium]